jgi:hypothetical protein
MYPYPDMDRLILISMDMNNASAGGARGESGSGRRSPAASGAPRLYQLAEGAPVPSPLH